MFAAVLLGGCASVPSSSAPQAIGTVERPAPSNLPKPIPGMDPDVLLREFLKATADPANRHLAARQFLTQSASNAWDDAGSALLIDHVVFVETRGAERVSATMRADILGSLSDMGVFETAEGELPDPGPIELVKTSGGWRIDRLPNGVFLDWQQFQSTYKRNTLYFADPTGKTVVPDPRYVAVSDHDQLATELVSKLLAGPRPEMAHSVRNLLAPPLRLRGPVTRADGGKSGIGKGYGGARIDLEKLSTTDSHSRQLLAAQIIWTLARADIRGPYVINADGAPLDDRFAEGWTTSDVAATDPGVADGAGRDCTPWWGVTRGAGRTADHHRRGAFGRMGDQTGAALSRTGRLVASVVTLRRGAPTWPPHCGSVSSAPRRCKPPTATICRGPAGRSTTRSGWWSTPTMCCARSKNLRPDSRPGFPSTPPRCPVASPGRSPICSSPETAPARRW
ncbi:sporulation and spore germination family protein [Mycobacterium ulcerans str. Harvey]|uniref:Sporulation and spore germination family protein n=1 Tax=Mycobacterium ulcerans str. Harvey TaxID=1299332 RepID=A0ABN0QXI0_MYCUL|nr:sporulation and spore germination family protein [Mycobacterium ulcerans str. Harvey]